MQFKTESTLLWSKQQEGDIDVSYLRCKPCHACCQFSLLRSEMRRGLFGSTLKACDDEPDFIDDSQNNVTGAYHAACVQLAKTLLLGSASTAVKMEGQSLQYTAPDAID